MEIDPFSMLEVSLQEGPDVSSARGHNSSSKVMHKVENDLPVVTKQPPPLRVYGPDSQRVVLGNIQKLANTSKDEEKFRRRAYSCISLVLRKRLHCTICDAHIGAYLGLREMDIEHPLLKVLACSKCTLKYHYLEFPLNPDGRDIRCRWCTNSSKEESPLRFCKYCPFAFCEMCIYRNLPLDELASNKNDWMCFVCNVKDLWPSRAVLWALRVLIDTNLALREEKKWSTDQSTCCKSKVVKHQQKRPVNLPPVVHMNNGHNIVPQSRVNPQQNIRPNRVSNSNNYRTFYNRTSNNNSVRPIQLVPATRGGVYKAVKGRPSMNVQPRPEITPLTTSASNQLFETAWLTDKVSNISTTILNLNNNLHRLAQGIPEKENKYSIKSKMISMVSLLNISATQLMKVSHEMEEESKKLLDRNYRSTRFISKEPKPSVSVIPSTSLPSKKVSQIKNRPTSNRRALKRSHDDGSSSDTDTPDDDDPDFVTGAAHDQPSAYELRTRKCFVKLERLNDQLLDNLNKFEPQPSTSTAPDPLGTVRPEELSDESDDDKDRLKMDIGDVKLSDSVVKMEGDDANVSLSDVKSVETADDDVNVPQVNTDGTIENVTSQAAGDVAPSVCTPGDVTSIPPIDTEPEDVNTVLPTNVENVPSALPEGEAPVLDSIVESIDQLAKPDGQNNPNEGSSAIRNDNPDNYPSNDPSIDL